MTAQHTPGAPARPDVADLSNWQAGAEDFYAAATRRRQPVRAVVHKATEGTTFTDGRYAQRRGEVAAANRRLSVRLRLRRRIRWGAYCYPHPTTAAGDAAAQARYFLAAAQLRPGDLWPMLDLENYGNLSTPELTSWVMQFQGVMVTELGVPAIIYTQHDLADQVAVYPLWASAYSDAMTGPRVPAPWRRWTLWQFTNGQYGHPRSVPGITGGDLSTIDGNPAKVLDRLTIPRRRRKSSGPAGHAQGSSSPSAPKILRPTHVRAAAHQLADAARWARKHGHQARAAAVSAILSKVRQLRGARRRRPGP